MKKMQFTATADRAYGKKLDASVDYAGEYDAYENPNEVRTAGAWPNDAKIVKWTNAESKTRARQAALALALDAAGIVKPTNENDPQLRLKNMFDVLMSSKLYTEDAARELAAKTLNLEWSEDED